MTRIIAGRYGGRRLGTPDGRGTRPTSDRVREALFSSLEAATELAGCRFADLYAGSGAVGLEAASRGAAHVLLVEHEPRAARLVRENIASLGVGAVATLTTARVEQVLSTAPGAPYDVIFADPPYLLADDQVGTVLERLVGNGWMARDTIVVVERATRSPEPEWPTGITRVRGRRYGETILWYGRAS